MSLLHCTLVPEYAFISSQLVQLSFLNAVAMLDLNSISNT